MNKRILLLPPMLLFSMMVLFGCQDSQPTSSSSTTAPAPSASAEPVDSPAAPETGNDGMSAQQPAETMAPGNAAEESDGDQAASGLTEDFLIKQKFALKNINNAEFTGERVPFLAFEENFLVIGRVCNNFRGPGKLVNGILTVGPIMSTKMACLNDGLGQMENQLFQMLEGGAEISMNGALLTLKQGDQVLTFEANANAGDSGSPETPDK